MSLSRLFSRELRPFFRMLEDPAAFTRPAYYPLSRHPFFDNSPFMGLGSGISPAVDVTENADGYVVHAEVPGVKKENIKVNLDDGGRTLSINGRVFVRQGGETPAAVNNAADAAKESSETAVAETSKDTSVQNQLYSERTFVGDASFSRSVQLPHPIDPSGITAKLNDGILTITANKLRDTNTSTTINVE